MNAWQNIPEELKNIPNWVCAGKNKIPINPNTKKSASVTDKNTWGTFEQACNAGYPAIGFVLEQSLNYCIIDLDNKPDNPCTLEQLTRHQKIYDHFVSYTERSTSGTGVHIVVKGAIPKGVHRDNVEVYSSERYMIFTGDILRNLPIADYQETLDLLYGEMKPVETVELIDRESVLSDQEVVEMGMRAENADKFNKLCAGDQTGYESQSEADFALLSIIAYYTPDNEQVRRIFRMTALGKREKAIRNNTYLNFALGKIRAQQPVPIDMDQLIANANAMMTKEIPNEEKITQTIPAHQNAIPPISKQAQNPIHQVSNQTSSESLSGIELPPGLVGELAQYFYQAAIRPVPEIALAAALAITAGVCGRSYNISGSGLNQYIILLAKTGSGKEGALSGMENLIAAIRPQLPMADGFMGPAAFASGQALVRVLSDRPCFVSVLGEFGLTLQELSDHRANSAQKMLKKVLLDLYGKSGWNRMLRASVYSDTEKNTAIVQAPNLTILGESTPETFFDGLDASHIAEGLIPRFSIMEYTGDRPTRNPHANQPPHKNLAQKFADLVTISLTTTNNGSCCQVQLDDHSLALLDDFDTRADTTMNASKMDVEMQLWNRAHLKALKLSALLAVGINPHKPIVTADLARWAIDFVVRDVELVTARFRTGNIGTGDSKQLNDLKKAVENYFSTQSTHTKKEGRFRSLWESKIVPYAYLMQRTAAVASFRLDKMGSTHALRRNVQTMIDSGMLVEISKQVLAEKYKFSGVAYGIGNHWG